MTKSVKSPIITHQYSICYEQRATSDERRADRSGLLTTNYSLLTRTASSRGSIPIYIVLLVLLTVTSAGVILSGVLARQIRSSRDLVAFERSFYAANSGVEEAYARLVEGLNDPSEVIRIEGNIEYSEADAVYSAEASLGGSIGETVRNICIRSEGEAQGKERTIVLRPPESECGFD